MNIPNTYKILPYTQLIKIQDLIDLYDKEHFIDTSTILENNNICASSVAVDVDKKLNVLNDKEKLIVMIYKYWFEYERFLNDTTKYKKKEKDIIKKNRIKYDNIINSVIERTNNNIKILDMTTLNKRQSECWSDKRYYENDFDGEFVKDELIKLSKDYIIEENETLKDYIDVRYFLEHKIRYEYRLDELQKLDGFLYWEIIKYQNERINKKYKNLFFKHRLFLY